MMLLEQFSHRIDKRKFDFIKQLAEQKLIDRSSTKFTDMSEKDRLVYKKNV